MVGIRPDLPLAEDILTSVRCMHVTEVERGEFYFAIQGWIPQAWYEDLLFIVEEGSRGRMTLLWDPKETPAIATQPTLVENPPLWRPFQSLVELFSLPGSAGFDPTFLTFLTLPFFFGFMIGDYGYGVVFLAAGRVLRRLLRTPLAELAASLLTFGGIWCIFFGLVVFGDFFGFPLPLLGFHLLDKLTDIQTLFLLSLVIGVVHINLGLVVSFVYERRRLGLRVAFLRRLSWLVVEAGVVVLLLSLLGAGLEPYTVPAFAVMAVGIALVSLGGGLLAVVELPMLVSALLSYLRLGVIAIAKGALSTAVNDLVLNTLLPQGLWGVGVSALLLVISHGFLMFLAVIIVGVHALRLHYVELYTHVYDLEGIGQEVPFEPVTFPPDTVEGA